MRKLLSLLSLAMALAPITAANANPTSVGVAAGGKALLPVVVSKEAPPRVREAAQVLADYLGRISGGKFEVVFGDGRSGLAVGQPTDFPGLKVKLPGDVKDPTSSEDYLLRSHAAGVYILGASELAVEHAVWDFLYRLGHRQFFPGPNWQVIPRRADLQVQLDTVERPSYHARRIWYGFGAWDYSAQPYRQWCAKNRAVAGIELRTGHAYDGIYLRNKKEFDAHPEYLGLVGGERRIHQLCISNAGLRKLVVEDSLAQLRRDSAAQSLSLEPADGGGWCECAECRKLGVVSDRALLLANEVAHALNKHRPGTYVGMYAYNQHSPPPTIKAYPQVIISVATGFIRGGYTVDQLLDGWHRQGATLGIREYYSVQTWDRDLPGAARAANLRYLKDTIPHFHAQGARFFSAESGDNWGPYGLGYYLAARMLWDVREAKRLDALVDDFLDKSFGPAREPMARFYRLLDGTRRPLLSDDLIGRMYRLLDEARRKTEDAAVQRRLDDLVLYTRYVELWSDYAIAEGQGRQAAFENLIRHAYRMRGTMMVHVKALYRDLAARDKSVRIPAEASWNVPEPRNPWKSSVAFARQELDEIVTRGLAKRKLFDFEPVAYGKDLVPATKLALPAVPTGTLGLCSRGTRTYHTWAAEGGVKLTLQVAGGRIYQNRGDAKLILFAEDDVEGKAADQATVAADRQERQVVLNSAAAGLHRVEVSDNSAGTELRWAEGTPMTVASSPENPASFHGRWSLYFYVPKGARMVGGYASGPGVLKAGNGTVVHTFAKQAGYFSVAVPQGQDGKLWKFENSLGQRLLMTVPPYLARNGRELLLPAEVVARDAPAR